MLLLYVPFLVEYQMGVGVGVGMKVVGRMRFARTLVILGWVGLGECDSPVLW